jgi:hypothetical protein
MLLQIFKYLQRISRKELVLDEKLKVSPFHLSKRVSEQRKIQRPRKNKKGCRLVGLDATKLPGNTNQNGRAVFK